MAKAALMPTVATQETEKWWEKNKSAPQVQAKQKIIQTITFRLGSFDDENRTFRAIASTPVVDRAGDVIEQDSWFLSNFMANPVIPWCHDYYQPPVARAIEIGVADGALQFTYQAPPKGLYEFADTIWEMYRNQFMFAFSVGFVPKHADGTDLDWDDYNWDGNVYKAAELLEISAVVVPANPQALALAQKSGIMDEKAARTFLAKTASAMKHLEDSLKEAEEKTAMKAEEEATSLSALEEAVERAVEKAMGKLQEAQTKAAISSDLATAPKDTSWDSGEAVKAIKKWASDSEGDIDFAKYRKCFMWVDEAEKGKQGGYKLPFADIVDGEPKAVWNAVKAIMAVLNGGRGGVDIPEDDKKSVYMQVKKYYKKFDEEVPELNAKSLTSDNNNGDSKGMKTSGSNKVDKKDLGDGMDGGGSLTPMQHTGDKGYAMADALHDVADTLKAHSDALNGHAETMKVHSNLIQSKVDTLHKAADYLKDLLDHNGDETTREEGVEEDSAIAPSDSDNELDTQNHPDSKLERSAKGAKKKAEVVLEDPKPEEEQVPEGAEGEPEIPRESEESPKEDESKAEEVVEETDKEAEPSGEVKSDEETPTDGADHKDEANEELVDEEDLSPDQIEKILKMVNEEMEKETDN